MGSSPVAVTYISDTAPVSSKEFLDIQVAKSVDSLTRTWHDKNIQASRIILLIFLYNNTFLYGVLFILHYVLSLDLAYIKVFVPYNILPFRNIIAIQITKTIDVIRLNWLRLDSYMNGILFRRNKQFALLLVQNDRV